VRRVFAPYMKMASGGLGIGLGVKDFRGIFVFTSRDALEQFVNSGWDASAQADAAAKAGDKGAAWAGAVDVAPGVGEAKPVETAHRILSARRPRLSQALPEVRRESRRA